MSSRKEQKEALRKERLEREQAAQSAQRRKQMVGYGVGGALALAAVVVVLVLVVAGGGDDDGGGGGASGGEVYPEGVAIPDPGPLSADLEAAAEEAGCELESKPGQSREHLDAGSLDNAIDYGQDPPTSGRHHPEWSEDDIYEEQPRNENLVHTLEHGRVIIWFDPKIPSEERGKLRTLYEEDPFHMVLTPDDSNPAYAVAATAWNADPAPNGTGQLLGCERFNDTVLDALRAFKDEHRDRGPEQVQ